MKKFLFILPLLILPILSGCNSSEKVSLSTWSYNKTEAIEIATESEFNEKLGYENFLVALYPEDIRCHCWTTFSHIINNVVAKEKFQIYKITTNVLKNSASSGMYTTMGFDLITTNAPSFYIVNNGKVPHKYSYVDNNAMFTDQVKFVKEIQDKCYMPGLTYLSLDEFKAVTQENHSVTLVMRHGCSDCSYVIPNVLYNFFKSNNTNIYALDIEEYRAKASDPQDVQERKAAEYQKIKDDLHLSDKYDSKYGYSLYGGVVPTLQVWEKGSVTDACVYLNDEYVEDGEYRTISTSYYTNERVANLKYLDKVKDKVLVGKTLLKSTYNDEIKQLHLPIITAFLETYCK